MTRKQAVEQLLDTIRKECEYTVGLTGISVFQEKILNAMAEVPREEFVPEDMKRCAYDDVPLPIGNGQTISQPYIVALMTELLQPQEDGIILEVGAGSGYQAAILSKLVKKVYTTKIIPSLMLQAKDRLQKLGYHNIEVLQGDGYNGLPQYAPYDGIIVTAAAEYIPPPLKDQLKLGGRLVIPVGPPRSTQHLLLVEKDARGKCITREILAVSFVPLTGGAHERIQD